MDHKDKKHETKHPMGMKKEIEKHHDKKMHMEKKKHKED